MWFLLILGNLLVLAVELPHMVRHRLRREWRVVLVITGINIMVGLLLAANVPMLSPTDLIEALFGPLGRAVGGG